MLYQWLRLIKSDNGTLTDISLANQNESTDLVMNLTVSEDYIYVGQQYPFNNFYIQSDVANDVASVMSIEYWDGSVWKNAVDVLDATSVNGVSLAQSGVVQFSPDYHYRWSFVPDTSDTAMSPTELRTLTIYNLYWIRIKWSATLNALTTIKKITYCFSSHQQIDNRDSTINAYLGSFAVGKTSWENEIITASMDVVLELKRKNLIVHEGQVLRFDDVSNATDWRTLINIYRDLGGDYKEKYDDALKEYSNALDVRRFSFDVNNDGFLSRGETNYYSMRLRRE